MKKTIILLGALCGSLLFADANDDAVWEKWRKAYSLFEEGDRLARKKDFSAARKSYDESCRLYQEIAKQAPDWNHTVVTNRMELAHRAIRDMERSGVSAHKKSSPVPQDLPSCQKALTEARARINDLEDETLHLRTSARSGQVSGADIEALLAEKRTLLAEQTSLRQRIAAQERRIEELSDSRSASLEQQILQLNALLETQKARSRAAEERVRTLENSLARESAVKDNALKRASLAEQEKENAERATATATFMARSREAELDQLQQDLTSAQVRIRNQETELRQRSNELENLQDRFSRLQVGRNQEISAELVAENAELRRKTAALSHQNAQLSEEAAVLDQHRIKLQKENTERKKAQAQQGETIDKLSHSLKMSQSAYQREAEAGKLGAAELKELRLSCRDLSAKIARLTGENRDIAEQLKNRDRQEQKDLNALTRRLNEMEQERSRLFAETKTLRERCEKMISQIDEKSEELSALKRASSQDKREIAVLRSENRKLHLAEQELAELQKNFAPAAAKPEAAGVATAAAKEPADSLHAELKLLRRRVSELEKQRDELALLLQQQGTRVPQGKTSSSGAESAGQLQQSMLSAARRAEAEGDKESAVWFYRELLKRDAGNPVYQEKIRTLSTPEK